MTLAVSTRPAASRPRDDTLRVPADPARPPPRTTDRTTRTPRGEAGRPTLPHWLLTYGDIMSVLLVLFAFLFALRTMRPAHHVSMHTRHNSLGLPVVLEVRFDPAESTIGKAEVAPARLRRLRDLRRRGPAGGAERRELEALESDPELLRLADLEELARKLPPGTRLAILGFASPRSAAGKDAAALVRIARRRARSVGRVLLDRTRRARAGASAHRTTGSGAEGAPRADGDGLPRVVYGALGTGDPAWNGPRTGANDPGTDDGRTWRDRVEICLLRGKLGREVDG